MVRAANALSAKAKAMYGKRLKEEAYQELCKKQEVSDIVSYLKNKEGYKEVLKEVNTRSLHRRQLELYLEKNFYDQCSKLIRFAPRKQRIFYIHESMQVEIEIIIDKIMHLKNKDYEPFFFTIPDSLTKLIHFDIYQLLSIDSLTELQQFLKQTRYQKVIESIDLTQVIDFNTVEKQFMEMYYDSYITIIKKHFKGKTQKELLDILLTSIELKNIEKMYRFKKFFHASTEEIESAIYMKYSRIPKETLHKLIQSKDDKEFMKVLTTSRYRNYISDDTFTYIEYFVEKIKYNIAKRYMRFSTNAAVVYLTYMVVQKIEIDNLKHIIEGIRYRTESTSITEMLIYV